MRPVLSIAADTLGVGAVLGLACLSWVCCKSCDKFKKAQRGHTPGTQGER